MKKYCRYCAWLKKASNTHVCVKHNKVMPDIKKVNNCKDYIESIAGDVDTGRKYRTSQNEKHMQMQTFMIFD